MCPCTYLLTYLHSWLCAYKTVHISKTVEHSAKFTMNGLHKIVRWLSIVAKMHDFKWPLRASFKVIDSLNSTKMTKYSLVVTPTPWRVAAALSFWAYVLMRSCTYSLTYLLTLNNQCFRQACRGYEISHPYPYPYPQIFERSLHAEMNATCILANYHRQICVDIYGYIHIHRRLSCLHVVTKFPQSAVGARGPSPKKKTQTFPS